MIRDIPARLVEYLVPPVAQAVLDDPVLLGLRAAATADPANHCTGPGAAFYIAVFQDGPQCATDYGTAGCALGDIFTGRHLVGVGLALGQVTAVVGHIGIALINDDALRRAGGQRHQHHR